MKSLSILFLLLVNITVTNAQRVIYTEPDKNDSRQTSFEIIGKVGGNMLIYKNNRSDFSITVYDGDMKQKDKVKLDFLPDRVINADFLAYQDYCYMFYQYQRKNIVYAMAARFDGTGKQVGKEVTMDTTEIGFLANNKIYSVINSDDKQYISLFKINSKNEDNYRVTTFLYNKDLQQKEKVVLHVPVPDNHDYLTEFTVDNEGDFAFIRAVEPQENEKIQKISLGLKKQGDSTVSIKTLDTKNTLLDDIRIKADNFNRHYIISSFFSKTRRGNIEGIYNCIWDKNVDSATNIATVEFDEGLRREARGDNSVKGAFNDFFIRNVIARKDGGFILAAESYFTSGRSNNLNRFDYMYGSPFFRPMDYYAFGPLGYGSPWSRFNNYGPNTRYNSQNIAVFSFDSTGKTTWSNVIPKNQYDDESDAFIGYSLVNSGDQLHFIFNQPERRLQLLSDQSITPDGKVIRNPTMKNLDQGFDFMARYGKQTGSRQIIFPCMYRNYLCFARIDL